MKLARTGPPRVGDRVLFAPGRPPYPGAPDVWQERRTTHSLVVYVGRRNPEGRGHDVALILDGDRTLLPWWAASGDLLVVGRASYADLGEHLDPDHAAAALRGSTVALDFDGPIHSYTSGWTGFEPTDPVTPGALAFVRMLAANGCRVVVHTSRADCARGVAGVRAYLAAHGFPDLEVVFEKIPAAAYVDDRAVHFDPRRGRGYDDALLAEVVRMCRTRHHGEAYEDARVGDADPGVTLTKGPELIGGADTESSASRQHYIDTGSYLPREEST